MYPTRRGPIMALRAERRGCRFGHTVARHQYSRLPVEAELPERCRRCRPKTRSSVTISSIAFMVKALPLGFVSMPCSFLTLHGKATLGGRFERFCSWVIWRFADAVIVVWRRCDTRPRIVIPWRCRSHLSGLTARQKHGPTRLARFDKSDAFFPFDQGAVVRV